MSNFLELIFSPLLCLGQVHGTNTKVIEIKLGLDASIPVCKSSAVPPALTAPLHLCTVHVQLPACGSLQGWCHFPHQGSRGNVVPATASIQSSRPSRLVFPPYSSNCLSGQPLKPCKFVSRWPGAECIVDNYSMLVEQSLGYPTANTIPFLSANYVFIFLGFSLWIKP